MTSKEFLTPREFISLCGLNLSNTGKLPLVIGIKPFQQKTQDLRTEWVIPITSEEAFQIRTALTRENAGRVIVESEANETSPTAKNQDIPLNEIFSEAFEYAGQTLKKLDLRNDSGYPRSLRASQWYTSIQPHLAALRDLIDKEKEKDRLDRILGKPSPGEVGYEFWCNLADKFRELTKQPEAPFVPGAPRIAVPKMVLQLNWTLSVTNMESDDWWLTGGSPEVLQHYETWAERGSRALGYTGNFSGPQAWYSLLKRDSAHFKNCCVFHYKYECLVCGNIEDLCKASAEYCQLVGNRHLSKGPEDDESQTDYKTALGRNITRFRKECGWSLDDLAEKTGIDKKSIVGHTKHGKGATPRLLKEYAEAFSKKLGQKITVAELEK